MKNNIKEQVRATIPTPWGDMVMIAYASDVNEYSPHLALLSREPVSDEAPTNVRIHSECITGDLFSSQKCDCGQQLYASLSYIEKHGGVLIYLRQEGRGIGIIPKLKAYNLQAKGMNTLDANLHLGYEADERTYEIAVNILKELGIEKINLLTNNPDKIHAFDESEIEIIDRIPLEILPNEHNKGYLDTKRMFMGHLLSDK